MSELDTIYLNHAGTSWPKPAPVSEAATDVLQQSAEDWPGLFEQLHTAVADFFHVAPPRLLLTPSCTAALDLAVMDHPWRSGDCVLTSHFEHHALHRHLVKLQRLGVDTRALRPAGDELIDLKQLEAELKSTDVRLLAITAACNVTGRLLPMAEAIELAHQHGTLVLIDGAQIAGWWDLDVTALGADLFTFAGHKGPQAPWGIGGLYVAPHVEMNCPAAACELSGSETAAACAVMPGYCDAGSVNLAALAGLAAGCDWLSAPAQQHRLQHARDLAEEFANSVRCVSGVVIHHDVDMNLKMPTVTITVDDIQSAELALWLRQKSVIISGGFQCAPQAHHALGTSRTGVLRFSFGPHSTAHDVARALKALEEAIR
ncbi:MAG: aminotransferase class V-fold PLP-dependent enzyme [Fuerstiella sp.]